MARDLESGIITAIDSQVKRPFLLAEIELDSATLRYSTLNRDVSWNSQTWLGNGYLKNISTVRESSELGAEGVSLDFVGELSALVTIGLSEVRQNKPGTIYLGLLDSSHAIITDPFVLFSGVVDTCIIADAGVVASITITLENELIVAQRPSALRYNNEAQQDLFSGDLLLEYMEQMQDWSGYWGVSNKTKKKKRGQ